MAEKSENLVIFLPGHGPIMANASAEAQPAPRIDNPLAAALIVVGVALVWALISSWAWKPRKWFRK